MTCVHILLQLTSAICEKKVWLRFVIFYQFYTPYKMATNKVHYRHLRLFFRKDKNAIKAANNIVGVAWDVLPHPPYVAVLDDDYKIHLLEKISILCDKNFFAEKPNRFRNKNSQIA